jgi:hypothetical protein
MMHNRICTLWANTVQQRKSMRIVGTGKPAISHHFQRRKNLGVFDGRLPKRQGDAHKDDTHHNEATTNEIDAHT